MSTSRTVSVSSKIEDKDGEGERERETFAQASETFAQTAETSDVGVGGVGVKEWVQMGGGQGGGEDIRIEFHYLSGS